MDERPTPTVFGALRVYKVSSLIIMAVTVCVSIGFGYLTQPDIKTTARMVLATPTSDDSVGVDAQTEPTFVRYVAQRALFATSNEVLRTAAADLGNTTVTSLRSHLTAAASTNGSAVTVTASADTAKKAAQMANAVVRAYQTESRKQMLREADASLGAIRSAQDKIVADLGKNGAVRDPTYQSLAEREGTITVAAAKFASGVTFVDPATAAAATKPGPPLVDAAVGLALGFLIAAAVAWLRADRALNGRPVDATDEVGSVDVEEGTDADADAELDADAEEEPAEPVEPDVKERLSPSPR